jgi:hypothetical protein
MNKEIMYTKMKVYAEEMAKKRAIQDFHSSKLRKARKEYCDLMGMSWHYQLRAGFVEYLKTKYGLEMTTLENNIDEYRIIDHDLYLLYILKFG